MNENVSLLNRVVVGCTVAVIAVVMFFGWSNQPVGLLVGQENSSVSPYADVELLAGPVVGHGSGG